MRSKYLDTENKEKIKGILRLSAGNPASLVLQYKEFQVQASGDVAQPAKKQPLSLETVLDKMHKTGSTPFTFQELEVQMEQGIFLPVQALNQLRRVAIEKLQNAILEKYIRTARARADLSGSFCHGTKKHAQRAAKIHCHGAKGKERMLPCASLCLSLEDGKMV